MFSNTFLIRMMSRIPSKKQSQWTPPEKNIYVLRTPEKHPMRLPCDFRKPRVPGRVSAAERLLFST